MSNSAYVYDGQAHNRQLVQLQTAQQCVDLKLGTVILEDDKLIGFDDFQYGQFLFKQTRFMYSTNPVVAARNAAKLEFERLTQLVKFGYHTPVTEDLMGPIVSQHANFKHLSKRFEKQLKQAQEYEDADLGILLTDITGRLTGFIDNRFGKLEILGTSYESAYDPVALVRQRAIDEYSSLSYMLKNDLGIKEKLQPIKIGPRISRILKFECEKLS